MPSAEATISTERPDHYLLQLCKHANAIGSGRPGPGIHLGSALTRRHVQVHAEWTDGHGVITFTPWGRCTLTTDAATLTLHIDAPDQTGLQNIQDIVTSDLARFTRRNTAAMRWLPVDFQRSVPENLAGRLEGSRQNDVADQPGRRAIVTCRVQVAGDDLTSCHAKQDEPTSTPGAPAGQHSDQSRAAGRASDGHRRGSARRDAAAQNGARPKHE